MPVYQYRCRSCGRDFEEYHKLSETDKQKATACPSCAGTAPRVFTRVSVFGTNPEMANLGDGDPAYEEMHYYEKKKDWQKAAEAAEGVSDFAKQKFLQKAQQEEN